MTSTDTAPRPQRGRAASTGAEPVEPTADGKATELTAALTEAEQLEQKAAEARARAAELAGTIEPDPYGNEAAVVAWTRGEFDFRHRRGCPVEAGRSTRMETHKDRTPANPEEGIPARDVLVVRCIECGESDVARRDGTRLDT